jgi:lysophospholipase L1-like esterase
MTKSNEVSGDGMQIKPVSKIVCLGDSITWGYPYGPDYSWVGLAARELAASLVNRGINGETAENLLYRFEDDVIAQYPSHVVITIGSNDASLNISLQSYQQHIRNLIDKTAAKGIVPIVGLPVPSKNRWLEYRLEKYRLWLTHYVQENSYLLLDFSPAMLSSDGNVNLACYSDEVHPSKTGYSNMSAVFKEFCRNSLGIAGF